MCGIVGIFDRDHDGLDFSTAVSSMVRTLEHRGPDDEGIWFDERAGIGLGHRRLSIIDLSSCGHQPMISASGRYCIVYNGEVYNYPDLRNELDKLGHNFKGRSDTEVILAAFEQWGVEDSLPGLNGMFSMGLWDRVERELYLIRDRVGIKPLYFGFVGKKFVFGSELKPFYHVPGFDNPVDRDVVNLYLSLNYIPAPYSIFKDIYKLEQGHYLKINSDMLSSRDCQIKCYWDFKHIAQRGCDDPLELDENQAQDRLEELITDSVSRRMMADVPLGAFLSGGIDSSLITAVMQKHSSVCVKTFTIGFNEDKYNEARHAEKIAQYLGTDHTQLYLSSGDIIKNIPSIIHFYDEPFADSSQIPTYLVSKLTRKYVTVALSGDGGDELFCGYNRYRHVHKCWNRIRLMGTEGAKLISRLIRHAPSWMLDMIFYIQKPFKAKSLSNFKERLFRVADFLDNDSFQSLYQHYLIHWNRMDEVSGCKSNLPTVFSEPGKWPKSHDDLLHMMYCDFMCYLPDDILTKVDRASMGSSLEARVPLLDHRIVEFAFSLPMNMKIRAGRQKWILKKLLAKYVPTELTDRPKSGFGIPVGQWLGKELRDWAGDYLNDSALNSNDFLVKDAVKDKWQRHISGESNFSAQLWTIIILQIWLSEMKRTRSASRKDF